MNQASEIQNVKIDGVVTGFPTFETRDLDYVAFLLSQQTLYVISRPGEQAVPIHPPLNVRIAEMTPYSDKDATNEERGVRYTFVMQGTNENEPQDLFDRRMRHVQFLFLNKSTLVEPIGFGAWRRQLRTWMTETDKKRLEFLRSKRDNRRYRY